MTKPTFDATDREKALYMLHRATQDAPAICAGRLTHDEFSELEIAMLAHAFEDGESNNRAHEVLGFQATRLQFQKTAEERIAKQVADAQAAEEAARKATEEATA